MVPGAGLLCHGSGDMFLHLTAIVRPTEAWTFGHVAVALVVIAVVVLIVRRLRVRHRG